MDMPLPPFRGLKAFKSQFAAFKRGFNKRNELCAAHQKRLARRAVPVRRIVMDAAIAHVDAIDYAITYRTAALGDPAAHAP